MNEKTWNFVVGLLRDELAIAEKVRSDKEQDLRDALIDLTGEDF